ncbi:phosphoenolpyruvate phosphomutase-domain-containing protein [Aspergillus alliaceus]|uniref:phosphoenolpyruvate phosphomutase-domain-containing protein n=1 Tax=Petromyces alliaceus TaxID=209559 RepID=UPI0012A748DA|nr:phosphoenolpyruvate phosphomutase-domain-containing protein [Aspergillus alliaceus]KAB8237610.1 phosphoenolpyruvate phosphomutase-domain-containing protein [Aspergillus alliaceus]
MAIRTAQNNQAIHFRSLHTPGKPILLTNVYDAATASLIASHPSTKAIATASYAIAASQGISDDALTLPRNLAAVRSIAAVLKSSDISDTEKLAGTVTKFPLTVDVQDGYADVAETIKEVINLGAVGCNIEDLDATGQLRPLSEAVARIELAVRTATELGVPDFVINARTDVLGSNPGGKPGSIEDAIERGKAYLRAGACTVFVWGGAGGRGVSREEIKELVAAFQGKLNVKLVLRDGFLTVPEVKELGVARISLGPELYRAAMSGFKEKADMVLAFDNPTQPFWRTEPHPLDECRSTEALPEQSDIVIVGAGYSGVSIAYHLLKHLGQHDKLHPAITILEARQICSGATGRNGGHLRPDLYDRIPAYIERHGVDAAAEVANFELSHIKAFKDLAEENIDCDFNITRCVNVYLDEAAGERAKKKYEALVSRGLAFADDVHYTSSKNAEGFSGVKGAKACLSYTSGTLWPYKLILGLLSKIADLPAVNVQTFTPVTSISSDDSGHIVNTPRGSIRTSKVVYASNAYTSALLPEYSANIVPCRGICCHIALPEGKTAPFLPYSYAIGTKTGKSGGSYLISRPDGSIIVGGAQYTFIDQKEQWYGVVDDSTLIEPTKDYYNDFMQRTFKGWEDSGAYVREIWTGIMGYSYDTSPHVGEIPGRSGQYICAGFDGHGMPVIFLAAKGLADMIHNGKSFEDVGLPRLYKSTIERITSARDGPEGGDILN